ncbi:hypothetical protein JCM10212_006493, partial [Sporobolomyces blumeae]
MDDLLDLPSPPRCTYPPGTYSLLPLIDLADSAHLPTGPWNLDDCEARWHHWTLSHSSPRLERTSEPSHARSTQDDSAIADDDDDDDDGDRDLTSNNPANESNETGDAKNEFITPFFVDLPAGPPRRPPRPPHSRPGAVRRRSSSSRSSTSFAPLTPLPSLRPSSPTPSHPLSSDSTRPLPPPPPQPIGYLRPSVVLALLRDSQTLINMSLRPAFEFYPPVEFERGDKQLRRPSYGSRPGSRRHSVKKDDRNDRPQERPDVVKWTDEPRSMTAREGSNDDHETGQRAKVPISALVASLESLSLSNKTATTTTTTTSQGSPLGVFAVSFADWVNEGGPELRKEHMDRVVRGWKMKGMFKDQLGGWRDEHYSIYGPAPPLAADQNPLPGSNVAFTVERSACSLFGFTTFGVHCTAYVEEEGEPIKIWIPRRSATKAT